MSGELIGYATITRDISEQKRSLELSEASKQKDRFLATLAHELRNPLAPIRTGLDLIQALSGDAAACEEPLQIMERQFDHLVHLVDDLLEVSRISRGKIELHKEQLDLAEIIDAALEMSDSGLNRGDRRVTVSVPSEPLVVEGDPVRLVQVITNLLNNAAKFSDAGGHIDVPDIVESLRLVLTMLGAEVRVAHDGADAIRALDEWTPTHLLMDLGMPGMDGYEGARRLRAKHADPAFRLIAMTGWGQEEDRQRTREAGFHEHLVKPVGLERLKEVLSV